MEYREPVDGDDQDIADLVNRSEPWRPYPLTKEELRRWRTEIADGEVNTSLVSATPAGRLVGWGWLRRDIWPPDGLLLSLDVDPHWRRRGIGSSLLSRLVGAGTGSAGEIATRVSEESEGGIQFVQANGFVERYRLYEFVLDLERPLELASANALSDQGITLTTLEAEDSAELRQSLYGLFCEALADVPSPDPAPIVSYGEWEAEWLGGPDAEQNIVVLALDRGRPVAVGLLIVRGESAWNAFTGVARSHRGRSLAKAVKLEGIRLLLERGVRSVRTENDTPNAAMIAINEKLGFQRRPGRIRFGLPLAGSSPDDHPARRRALQC